MAKEGIIDLLVQRSSGQFIYAATVLKFVGSDFYSPSKQLALVLRRLQVFKMSLSHVSHVTLLSLIFLPLHRPNYPLLWMHLRTMNLKRA